MKAREVRNNLYLLGAVDWDRRLFDALIPLPQGTSYNAYLVKGGEKTVLLDTVDLARWETLRAQLEEVPKVDYVVHHHGEQDHSGSLPMVLEMYPNAKVVTNERCKVELIDHLHVPADRFQVVNDGDTLSLGNKTLTFAFTPWVHWPETMCTWLKEDKVLFSCDFFGAHLATTDLYAGPAVVQGPAKRYYAEIMMPFAAQVAKNVDKVMQHKIEVIAPSHGPLYEKPKLIVDAYREWTAGEPRNVVCLPFVSMHESTRVMVDHLTGAHRARRGRGALRPRPLSTWVSLRCARRRRDHRHRHADGAHRPASAGRVRRLRRQRAQAQGQMGGGDRLVRVGRQDGRQARPAHAAAQAGALPAGALQGPAAGRGLRGSRHPGGRYRRAAPGAGGALTAG